MNMLVNGFCFVQSIYQYCFVPIDQKKSECRERLNEINRTIAIAEKRFNAIKALTQSEEVTLKNWERFSIHRLNDLKRGAKAIDGLLLEDLGIGYIINKNFRLCQQVENRLQQGLFGYQCRVITGVFEQAKLRYDSMGEVFMQREELVKEFKKKFPDEKEHACYKMVEQKLFQLLEVSVEIDVSWEEFSKVQSLATRLIESRHYIHYGELKSVEAGALACIKLDKLHAQFATYSTDIEKEIQEAGPVLEEEIKSRQPSVMEELGSVAGTLLAVFGHLLYEILKKELEKEPNRFTPYKTELEKMEEELERKRREEKFKPQAKK